MSTVSFWRAGLAAGLFLGWGLAPGLALPRCRTRDPSPLLQRGADVGIALLVDYYNELPKLAEDASRGDKVARQKALEKFKQKVAERYHEGTLQRLLDASSVRARRAAVLALGLLGTMRSNKELAAMLRDDDLQVRQLAVNALWSLWFRAGGDVNNQELQRLTRLGDPDKTLAGLDALIKQAPDFAEAYNQRAILHFRRGVYQKSIADCEMVLKLNPCHFGAQSGMAQCYMKLKKPRAALKAFRSAFRINPELEGVQETIRALEDVLGEEGKK